ncbi:protein YOP1 [Rhodotorula toruloides NP11]|uniref:Protein YOP1 n=1 Tax=Rhodotorula toruloides (strain NP11) TaxID=1130832 RepID=M7WXV1_RHOT1|nr:protein YOP1 [Rhodotorula toruloides NP11]EMS22680.1 protein YOP1 [Rhodotorula toruloides NP11]
MATAQQKFDYYISQVDKELSKYPTLNRLEAQTSIPKAYAVLGVGALFSTFIFFNIFAGFLSNLLGWALPAYFSLKALESPGHDDDVQWLTYWVIFGSFTFIESLISVPLLLRRQVPFHPVPHPPLDPRRHRRPRQALQAPPHPAQDPRYLDHHDHPRRCRSVNLPPLARHCSR